MNEELRAQITEIERALAQLEMMVHAATARTESVEALLVQLAGQVDDLLALEASAQPPSERAMRVAAKPLQRIEKE